MYLFLSINKKILIIILFFIAILSFYLYNKRVTVPSNSRDINFLVVIDPGHGGIDKGTNYGHVFEKDINLKIGKYLYQELIKVNIKALMTRKTDILYADSRNKDIKHRPQAANKNNADLFISIHANNFRTSQPSGSQVFYKKASDKSKKLAEDIHNELISLRKENNRCLKTGNYYVLNCTDCPAVLIETGFLSNPEDRRLLSNPDYQKRLAVKIKNGIVEYLRNEINNSEKNTASVYQTTQTIQQNIPSNKVVYFSQDNNVSLVTKNLVFPTNNFFSNDINEMNFTELLSISAIKQLMNPPENLCSPLPEGTKIRSINYVNSILTIDFSEELQNNFNYGTNIETKTIKAITETLLSINRVRGIKILINGQSNQTIGGHIVLKTIYRK